MSSSRPWKVTAREPIRETVVADDKVETKLEVLDVLPPGGTARVLEGVLANRGYESRDGKMVREDGGVEVEIDPETGGVTISAQESADVPPEEPKGGCPCAARLREKAAQASRDNVEKGLQARVTSRLEKALAGIGCELEKISHEATGKALVQSAKQVGNLKRIEHDNASGAITIVVEV